MFHGALAAVTAHMRSAAVNSLGVLLFRFSRTPEIEALAPEILRTIVLLLREKVRVLSLDASLSFHTLLRAPSRALAPSLPCLYVRPVCLVCLARDYYNHIFKRISETLHAEKCGACCG